jgi:hypothetical protein
LKGPPLLITKQGPELLGAFRDEAEKQGTFDFSAISSLISELSPPDCRSSTVLERDLSDALTLLSLPRAQVYIQSFSALPTSVLYGLQLRQAREAKGFELSVSMLTNLFKAGHRVAGTLLTEVEKLRVKPGQGGQRFTSDRKEFPTWENSVLLYMTQGSAISQNAFIRTIELLIAETDEPERQSVTALHHEIYSYKLKLSLDLKASLDCPLMTLSS